MANKIRTEADARATPRPPAPKGVTVTVHKGQKRSLERGVAHAQQEEPRQAPEEGRLKPQVPARTGRRTDCRARRGAPAHLPAP